jgi:uncharacterized protein
MMPFVDRQAELEGLRALWRSDRAEFVVVYGRRRVGKTSLLRVFTQEVPNLYWMATLGAEPALRAEFSETVHRARRPSAGEAPIYPSWEAALLALAELAEHDRFVAVIDEFPYLVAADSSIASVLQRVWDESLQRSRLMLVLCGSHLGMMEREVLSYGAPLYGRRTGQIDLGPLPLSALADLYSRYDAGQRMETYAILGGIPAYLAQFDDERTVLENVEQRVLDPLGFLYREPEFLLREELRDPRLYQALLLAIAQGRTRLSEIAQVVGLERTSVPGYLKVLGDLRLIERRVPVTEPRPATSRRGIYKLRDSFLSFYYRFIAPQASFLERGYREPLMRRIAEQLPVFVAGAFEEQCRLWLFSQTATMPFLPEQIGSWWDDEDEIDVVAASHSERKLLVGECKWWSRPVGANVLSELRRRAARLEAQHWTVAGYFLFSRSGFTPELEAAARRGEVRLVSVDEVARPDASSAGPG